MSDRDNTTDKYEWPYGDFVQTPEDMTYQYYGVPYVGSSRELTREQRQWINDLMYSRMGNESWTGKEFGSFKNEDGFDVNWVAVVDKDTITSYRNSSELIPNDPPEPKGAWVAYLPNSPRAIIFETEVEALRAAVEHGGKCKFWVFGEELNSPPSVKEIYDNLLLTANEMRGRYYPFNDITDLESDNDDKPD